MSSSSDPTKLATSTIPQFDGTNYKKCSTVTVPVPGLARPIAATGTPTATEIAAQAAWDEKNDKALGIIQLYVAQNLLHLVDDKFLALDAWTAIKAGYEKPGVVGAFVAFQKLFNAQLSDSSVLGPQLNALTEQSNQVNAVSCTIIISIGKLKK
ncbi:uncharacterized protein PHACADRAFT_200473 [Phanerochaete carnosa HHB-10118-sp]|uniref:Uncharacterized protein n=1 Tax=Phanerochaete carnosa (strain HHB-10118-sp) TaxID=650164 RepID=K5VH22_PHACS|nr:uncharacterized protein PHACADRAFT_200473 [Phanerochaete carnosa HHB-10118-sp]EKM50523.1 hypothetical protein PHACADRAFT_200473 [Phanerochaete carnosa HHB-10118-sp]